MEGHMEKDGFHPHRNYNKKSIHSDSIAKEKHIRTSETPSRFLVNSPYKCKECGTKIDVNQHHHRGGLCLICEEKLERKSLEAKEQRLAEIRNMTDSQLESSWQGQTSMIAAGVGQLWKTPEENKDEKKRLEKIINAARQRQDEIQAEITRRAK